MATSDDSRVRRQSSSDVSDAPHPDDPRKPQSPSQLGKPAWKFALKRALAEFSDDECTDLAAALTYYAVLSLFPAAIAVISLLGVFGQGPSTINALLPRFTVSLVPTGAQVTITFSVLPWKTKPQSLLFSFTQPR